MLSAIPETERRSGCENCDHRHDCQGSLLLSSDSVAVTAGEERGERGAELATKQKDGPLAGIFVSQCV